MQLKVLLIETGGWGGISHYCYNLALALAKEAGLKVAVLTNARYELESLPRNFDLIKASFDPRMNLAAIRAIVKHIRVIKPDIVHVQSLISARKDWFWFILGNIFRIKIVYTAHNILPHEEFEQRAFFMRKAFRIIYGNAAHIIVHSQFSKNKLLDFCPIPENKISVIPHGNYKFARFSLISQPQARKELGIPLDARVVLNFGAMRKYKGIEDLLDAFRLLQQKHAQAYLMLVGLPMHLPVNYVADLIRDYRLGERVFLEMSYIPISRIALYFCACDLVSLPYREIDGSGALQLAYAFAKPVVATRVGGLIETVKDGQNGKLVKPNDIEELRQALELILFNPGLLKSMGDLSYKMAGEDFSWEKIAFSTAGLYRGLLN